MKIFIIGGCAQSGKSTFGNLLKEESLLSQLNKNNQKINNLITDKDECIKKINNENDLLKQYNKDMNNDNNKICNLLNEFKKYMSLIICQNKNNCVDCLL